MSYSGPPLTPIYLCTQFIDASGVPYYWDDVNGTWTTTNTSACRTVTTGPVIWALVGDLIDTIVDLITHVEKDVIDPAVCPVLASLASSYGPVTINAQGDIFIDGEPLWDCPPYDLRG